VSDDKDFRAGAYSGLLAVIMVIALAVMAMTALGTEPEVRMAQVEQPAVHQSATPRVDFR
jgi:hypothetical protein